MTKIQSAYQERLRAMRVVMDAGRGYTGDELGARILDNVNLYLKDMEFYVETHAIAESATAEFWEGKAC